MWQTRSVVLTRNGRMYACTYSLQIKFRHSGILSGKEIWNIQLYVLSAVRERPFEKYCFSFHITEMHFCHCRYISVMGKYLYTRLGLWRLSHPYFVDQTIDEI